VDCVVVVDVPEEVQLQRAARRDANSEEQIRRIMAAQMQRQQRLERADIVIDNSRPLADLEGVVGELHKEFLLRAEQSR
jgi:dephospho-CoA kinase